MHTSERIDSILRAKSLDSKITGLPSFQLSQLDIPTELEFPLPTNLRLGHLAEKIVSYLLKASNNYEVIYENVQLKVDKITIGEIDFLLEERSSKKQFHLELAYKFYLYDPTLSLEEINNWVGPNRNDSLSNKLDKLKRKQFPLLSHPCTSTMLQKIEVKSVSQVLCLLANLYIPKTFKGHLDPCFQKLIRGYYLDLETCFALNTPSKSYYFPHKREWGMDPQNNVSWCDLTELEVQLKESLREKQAVLCWQKDGVSYEEFFVVWW